MMLWGKAVRQGREQPVNKSTGIFNWVATTSFIKHCKLTMYLSWKPTEKTEKDENKH
jgi:hypothetical protein